MYFYNIKILLIDNNLFNSGKFDIYKSKIFK